MTQTSEPDALLMARSANDPGSFDPIFERHFPGVWEYLRQRVGPALADDLTAATFANGFAARRSFTGDGSARPWLLRIASNLAADHWRAQERQLRAYARTGVASPEGLDEDGLLSRIHASNQAPLIAEAIAELSDTDRDMLLLSALAGLSNIEIAEAFGLTPNAAGVRLHRIRVGMAGRLNEPNAAECRCTTT